MEANGNRCPRCGGEWLPHMYRCGTCWATKEEIVLGHRHDAILGANSEPVPIGSVESVEIAAEQA
jgi:DNA-directed RNA polymerase subunit RPC12/RpoP